MVFRFLLITTVLLCHPAYAHNVIGGVYAIGSVIEGEAGFSNGDMAKAGSVVEIYNPDQELIAETTTDEEGFFSFQASQRIDHHFRLDLGAGHVLKMVLPADELPDTLPGPVQATGVNRSEVAAGEAATESAAKVPAQLQLMIEKAVAKQVKPLRKELAAYKEKASFQDVIGGIGYIFGLCGIGIWIHNRKQGKKHASVS